MHQTDRSKKKQLPELHITATQTMKGKKHQHDEKLTLEGSMRSRRASDLIEAGLNEPLPRPSNGRDSGPMIFNGRQAQTQAQLSDGTDFAKWGRRLFDLTCCQWVRRGAKVTRDKPGNGLQGARRSCRKR